MLKIFQQFAARREAASLVRDVNVNASMYECVPAVGVPGQLTRREYYEARPVKPGLFELFNVRAQFLALGPIRFPIGHSEKQVIENQRSSFTRAEIENYFSRLPEMRAD